jgi:hypothetical protein
VGTQSVAIGFQPTPNTGAWATNAIAIGTDATAGTAGPGPGIGTNVGSNAIAIGTLSSALQDNSVAIGAGATTTAANQMMFGVGPGNTLGLPATSYYLPGLPAGPAASDGHVIVSVDPATGQLTRAPVTVLDTGLEMGTLKTNGLASLDSLDVTNGATFNGGATITGGGLGVTGGTTTDTLEVTGETTTNGITNTGNIQTTTLNATTSITTPLLEATTANVETVNVGTAFSAAAGATIDMGGNRVQNVGAPVVGTDAANKAYVDAGLNKAFKEIDENTQGVAIALAMGSIFVPDSKAFSLSAGYGTFGGANAFATQMALRMNASTIVTGGVGVGLDHGDAPTQAGGRLGFQVSW